MKLTNKTTVLFFKFFEKKCSKNSLSQFYYEFLMLCTVQTKLFTCYTKTTIDFFLAFQQLIFIDKKIMSMKTKNQENQHFEFFDKINKKKIQIHFHLSKASSSTTTRIFASILPLVTNWFPLTISLTIKHSTTKHSI
jgi:hypothetical protein